jgi:hypothetical protein
MLGSAPLFAYVHDGFSPTLLLMFMLGSAHFIAHVHVASEGHGLMDNLCLARNGAPHLHVELAQGLAACIDHDVSHAVA